MSYRVFRGLVPVLIAALPAAASAQVHLEEVTIPCGLGNLGGDRFSFGDYDADSDPDLLVNGARLYRNDSRVGKIRFVEVTEEVGLKGARGPGACWFDFDRDGRLDFATTAGQVWIQDKTGSFREIGKHLALAFPTGQTSAMGWGDLDGDGYLECLSGGGENGKTFKCERQTLWLNSKRKPIEKIKSPSKIPKLVEAAQKMGLSATGRYGRAIIWCDYDWDGDDDVYSGNYRLQPNALFRNDLGKLKDVAAEAGVRGRFDPQMFTIPWSGEKAGYMYGHTIGASWGDLNDDGYFDLWVSNLVHKGVGKVSKEFAKVLGSRYDTRGFICDDSNLFINQGPPLYQFVDRRTEMGIPCKPVKDYSFYKGDELWSNAALGDLDNNGWLDCYVNQVYGHLPYSYCQIFLGSGGKFREAQAEVGVKLWGGYGSALADIDSDGHLDLVAGGAAQCKGKLLVHVYRNQGNEVPWIGFRIPCTKSYARIGAKILLVQEEGVQLRQVATTMGSHTQQSEMRLHFGLGSGGAIEDVVLYWPDGKIQSLGPLKPNRYYRVRKRRGYAPRLGRLTPTKVKAGEEVRFRIGAQAKKDTLFAWDFEGSRRPEVITSEPIARYRFAAPGRHVVWVRAAKPGSLAAERTCTITVE